jgi:hypothetical protein
MVKRINETFNFFTIRRHFALLVQGGALKIAEAPLGIPHFQRRPWFALADERNAGMTNLWNK